MQEQKQDEEFSAGRAFTATQRRILGIKSDFDDEKIIYELLKILGDKELSIDRASRILMDAQTMLPILAKLPKK